jgi:hypothetical protein
MSKIKVHVSFRQVVTFTKQVEMEAMDYQNLAEQLDRARGREHRNLEEDLFGRMNFSASDADYGANDPELDDFYQVS